MNIGNKIIELRKKCNLTQTKLAEKIGVSRQTLSNWESDITSPDLNQAKLLSQNLKISLDELVNNDIGIICNEKDTILMHLIGKNCQLRIDDDLLDFNLTEATNVKVLGIESDFIKVEYTKNKKKCVQLIDMDLINYIKVKEEE